MLGLVGLGVLLGTTSGCVWMSRLGSDEAGLPHGKTWFVGGAGSVGNVVGTFDVPKGLRAARYRGAIEVFGWQSVVGGTLRDMLDRERNEGEARRLAAAIQQYLDQYPGRRVNLIALSAGTGIATWALEALPPTHRVGTVVYLGSALSRDYDLSRALTNVRGRLHCFYSADDPLLRYGVPITGAVDRSSPIAAGLYGFARPPAAEGPALAVYVRRLRNHPYRREYAEYGYFGWHADSTSPRFIEKVVAPLLDERLEPD